MEAERSLSVPEVPMCPEVVCTPSLSRENRNWGSLGVYEEQKLRALEVDI